MGSPFGRSLLILVVFGALFVSGGATWAQEWTRFRGPNGSGISDAAGIPVTFKEADVNWRVALPGGGASSPVVWGRRVFVTSAEEERGRRYLVCLDAGDGHTLWSRAVPFASHPKHQLNTFASSTPAVDGEQVYVLWMEPERVSVQALDHEGKEAWKRDLGSYHAQHGGGTSPIVVGEVVIVLFDQEQGGPAAAAGAESFIVGLDRKSGAVRWKRPYASGSSGGYATPAVYQVSGGQPEVICSSTALGIAGLDPRTGELNWALPGVVKQRCVASPVFADGRVFQTAGTGGGEKQLVVVRAGAKEPGRAAKVEYEIPRDISYVPTPVVYGDRLFIWGDGGIVTCMKAATGEVVARERVGGTYYGSPVCVSGKLYAMNNGGELVVVEASDSLKLLGKSDLGEESEATPAVAGGVMYLRTRGHLISVGGRMRKDAVN